MFGFSHVLRQKRHFQWDADLDCVNIAVMHTLDAVVASNQSIVEFPEFAVMVSNQSVEGLPECAVLVSNQSVEGFPDLVSNHSVEGSPGFAVGSGQVLDLGTFHVIGAEYMTWMVPFMSVTTRPF